MSLSRFAGAGSWRSEMSEENASHYPEIKIDP